MRSLEFLGSVVQSLFNKQGEAIASLLISQVPIRMLLASLSAAEGLFRNQSSGSMSSSSQRLSFPELSRTISIRA